MQTFQSFSVFFPPDNVVNIYNELISPFFRTEVDLDSLDDMLPPAPSEPKSEGVWRLVRSDERDKKTNQLFTTMTWVVSQRSTTELWNVISPGLSTFTSTFTDYTSVLDCSLPNQYQNSRSTTNFRTFPKITEDVILLSEKVSKHCSEVISRSVLDCPLQDQYHNSRSNANFRTFPKVTEDVILLSEKVSEHCSEVISMKK